MRGLNLLIDACVLTWYEKLSNEDYQVIYIPRPVARLFFSNRDPCPTGSNPVLDEVSMTFAKPQFW